LGVGRNAVLGGGADDEDRHERAGGRDRVEHYTEPEHVDRQEILHGSVTRRGQVKYEVGRCRRHRIGDGSAVADVTPMPRSLPANGRLAASEPVQLVAVSIELCPERGSSEA
jgi:hypothetical protein